MVGKGLRSTQRVPRGLRRDRFGQPVHTEPKWGWRTLRCTGPCGMDVGVFEIPAKYLDEPYWGAFVCTDCRRPGVLPVAA